MNTRHFILSALFIAVLTMPGTIYAHDGDGSGADGRDGWKHHGDCHKAQLPEEKRKLLHETMKAAFERNKGLFEQMHTLHHKLHDILKADAFDKQAFLNTSAQIEKLHDRVHKIRTDAFASIAGQFTPEERETVARMHRHHHHHHGKDGQWHHHDGDGHDRSMNDGQSPAQDENGYPPYPSK